MILSLAAASAACGGNGVASGGGGTPPAPQTLSPAAQLGEKIFEDKALSVSGRQACSTCHVAAFAFAGDRALRARTTARPCRSAASP